jgi:branched-chain amino acid transport system substrate-binding protein
MRRVFVAAGLAASCLVSSTVVFAAEPIKIGVINTLTGESASLGDATDKGIRLYMKMHPDGLPPGVRIELVTRDDGGPNPEQARRLAQELILRDKVQILTGLVWSPSGAAVAPVVTETKTPTVLMNAASSQIVTMSPYFVRVSFGTWHAPFDVGQYAAQHYKRVFVAVSDYSSGHDSQAAFEKGFASAGGSGEIVGRVRMPLITADYTPFVQRAKDTRPDALFAMVSAGKMATAIMKAYGDLGLRQAGVKIIGTGNITPDDELANMGDAALGVITVHHWSAAADRPANRAFIAAWHREYGSASTPSFFAVQAWDGMDAIYSAIREQNGQVSSEKTLALLRHYRNADSPRGPIAIDPETGDIIQNQYLREVRKVDGQLANVELEAIGTPRRDPWHDFNKK